MTKWAQLPRWTWQSSKVGRGYMLLCMYGRIYPRSCLPLGRTQHTESIPRCTRGDSGVCNEDTKNCSSFTSCSSAFASTEEPTTTTPLARVDAALLILALVVWNRASETVCVIQFQSMLVLVQSKGMSSSRSHAGKKYYLSQLRTLPVPMENLAQASTNLGKPFQHKQKGDHEAEALDR